MDESLIIPYKLPVPWTSDTTGQLIKGGSIRTKEWTKLAKKYGHPMGVLEGQNHRILKKTGKSGFTPLSPFHPHNHDMAKTRLHYYQQNRYHGFSAAELQKLEALSALDDRITKTNLKNSIHPLLAKTQWETEANMPAHLGPIPIRGDHDGYWLAENPIVWEVLKPCLQLTSQLLDHAYLYPWWDALFHGDRNPIPNYRKPVESRLIDLYKFCRRSPQISSSIETQRLIAQRFIAYASKIKFKLWSGYTFIDSYLPSHAHAPTCGHTYHRREQDFITIHLGIETVQPLLRSDLTDSERAVNQYIVATTVLHEIAHACDALMGKEHLLMSQDPKLFAREPYFEDERLSELGWSMEDKIWGGVPEVFHNPVYARGGPGLPALGFFKTNWFIDKHGSYNSGLNSPPLEEDGRQFPGTLDRWNTYEYFPVPVSWACELFQDDFWNGTVRRVGAAATTMGPISAGYLVDGSKPNNIENYTSFSAPTYNPIPINASMPMVQQQELLWNNARNKRAHETRLALNDPAIHPGSGVPEFRRRMTLSGETAVDDAPEQESDYERDWDADDRNLVYPRYDEIKEYLFRNRAPLQLALDSMTFDMPEPNLYKYIMRRGGLAITPAEFRQFLKFTSKLQLLFRYLELPGVGIITRVEAGWPPAVKHVIEKLTPPDETRITYFKDLIQRNIFQLSIYTCQGEYRDIDMQRLREFVNGFYRFPFDHIPPGDAMFELVNELARNDDDWITLGPNRDVARLKAGITEEMRYNDPTDWPSEKRSLNKNWDGEDKIKVAELAQKAEDAAEAAKQAKEAADKEAIQKTL